MNNSIILNIGVIANYDRTKICANGNTGSYQTFITDFYITHYNGIGWTKESVDTCGLFPSNS